MSLTQERIYTIATEVASNTAVSEALFDKELFDFVDSFLSRIREEQEAAKFVVGNSYQMQNGDYVRFVKVHNEGTDYETMEDENGVNRYTNRKGDMGRVTGSPIDYSEPRNTPPLFTAPPASQACNCKELVEALGLPEIEEV